MHDRWWIPMLAGLVLLPAGIAMMRFSAQKQFGTSDAFRAWVVLLTGLACLIGSVVILLQRVF